MTAFPAAQDVLEVAQEPLGVFLAAEKFFKRQKLERPLSQTSVDFQGGRPSRRRRRSVQKQPSGMYPFLRRNPLLEVIQHLHNLRVVLDRYPSPADNLGVDGPRHAHFRAEYRRVLPRVGVVRVHRPPHAHSLPGRGARRSRRPRPCPLARHSFLSCMHSRHYIHYSLMYFCLNLIPHCFHSIGSRTFARGNLFQFVSHPFFQFFPKRLQEPLASVRGGRPVGRLLARILNRKFLDGLQCCTVGLRVEFGV